MSTIKNLLVTVFCCYFLVACSGEDKKGPASGEPGAKSGEDNEKKPVGETDKASGPAKKNPLGGLGSLMGGKKKASAKKSGLLGGLGVGGMLGGMGAAPAGAADKAAVAEAVEGKMGKQESARDVGKQAPPVAPPPVAAGKDCQAVAAHLGKIIEKEMKSGQLQGMDVAPEMIAQMGPMMAMACEQQAWSPEAKACILKGREAVIGRPALGGFHVFF